MHVRRMPSDGRAALVSVRAYASRGRGRSTIDARVVLAIISAGFLVPYVYYPHAGAGLFSFDAATSFGLADAGWKVPGAILLCGRFEGLDERVIEARKLEEISLGDFVLAAARSQLRRCWRLASGFCRGWPGMLSPWPRKASKPACWSIPSIPGPRPGRAATFPKH